MGSVGTAVQTKETSFVGRSVKDLSDAFTGTDDELRDRFDLEEATYAQLVTLRNVFRGMAEYDRDYSDERVPYKIRYYTVRHLGDTRTEEEKTSLRDLGMRLSARPISVSIVTVPDTDSAMLRLTDEKTHRFIVGARGGLYDYTDGGRKVTVSDFDAKYGKRTGIYADEGRKRR